MRNIQYCQPTWADTWRHISIVLALKPEQLSPLLACFCFDTSRQGFQHKIYFLCSKQDLSLSLLGKTQNLTGKYRQTNFFASLNANTKQLCRVEICHNRCDRRSCKICSSCVSFFPEYNAFPWIILVEVQELHTASVILHWNCKKFTHSVKFEKKITQFTDFNAFT